jgi:hypothetical protein
MSRLAIITLTLIMPLIINQNVFSQWLDPQTLQSTVLLEKIQNDSFITHGTGILIHNYDIPNEFIVVTCAHLIAGKSEISVRVKPDSTFLKLWKQTGQKQVIIENAIFIGNTVRFIAKLDDKYSFSQSDLDIAAFRLKIPPIFLTSDTVTKRINVTNLLGIPTKSGIEYRKNLSLGDEIYFVGFPLGYGATEFVDPIVRSGSIAWIPSTEKMFLIDALSYGGNSGSPIFKKRIIGAKPGSISWSDTKLIGMVIGHQSIQIKNILNQPDPKQLKFEVTDVDLNIGLATCVYADDIMYAIDKLMENIK